MSGSKYAEDPTWDGDFLTFDLSEDPIEIAKGNSKTVELHADIAGGLASTANFDIYRDWHIEGTGAVYHYGVNVTEDGTSITPTARNIVGGNIAFSLSSNNPVTGDVKKGANDAEFTKFNISTAGDGVTVRKISLTVNANAGNVDTTLANIDDVKIWTKNASDEWYVVAGPNDATGGVNNQTLSYTDTFDVPAATTQEFMVTADIANGASANDKYDVDVADVTVAANTELEYLSDGTPVNVATEVTGGMLNGNEMTVNTPTLTVSLSATPGDKTYVRNTTDRDLVAFDMSASTADDLRVTGMTVTCSNTAAGDCATAFQSLYLYEKDGATLTKLDASARSMSDVGAGDGTVTFSLNHTITKGATSRLLVRSDLSSGAVSDGYTFNVSAVTAEDTDSSAATITPALPLVANRTVTVAANGAFSNQSVTDSSLQARIVASLATDEPIMKVKFSADDLEAWYIKKMNIELPTGSDADISKVYINYTDNNGDAQVASGTMSSNEVQFDGLNIYVPASGSQTVDVTLDMGNVTTGGATAGDLMQLVFDPINNDHAAVLEFQAIGASSAKAYDETAANPATLITSNTLRLAKSFPVVAKEDLSTAFANGEISIYKWTVAADDANDISMKQIAFDVNQSGVVAADISNFKLFRNGVLVSDSADVDIVSQAGVDLEGGAPGALPTQVLVQWNDATSTGEDIIPAGTSVTYELKATFINVATGDSWTTTIASDTAGNAGLITNAAGKIAVATVASNFVWSDLSVSPHNSQVGGPSSTDWLDGYLVSGLSAAGSQVLSK